MDEVNKKRKDTDKTAIIVALITGVFGFLSSVVSAIISSMLSEPQTVILTRTIEKPLDLTNYFIASSITFLVIVIALLRIYKRKRNVS